jgi:hypothetical protein
VLQEGVKLGLVRVESLPRITSLCILKGMYLDRGVFGRVCDRNDILTEITLIAAITIDG